MSLIEVRWHGRGGQGVVTASDLLAKAAILEGKYAWHAPMFGPERSGAPVVAFTRVSDEVIEIHSGVYNPDVIVVIDPTQVIEVDWYLEGVKDGGTVVVNAKDLPDKLIKEVQKKHLKLFYVDAYTIALDTFNRKTQEIVSGKVKVKMYKGSLRVVGRSSPHSLYVYSYATYESVSKFDQKAALGFIELWSLQTRLANMVKKGVEGHT